MSDSHCPVTTGYESRVEKINDIIESCHERLEDLKAAEKIKHEHDHWHMFLSDVHTITEAIQEAYGGSSERKKLTAEYVEWEKAHLLITKSDDLLKYMKNARNSTAHRNTKAATTNTLKTLFQDKNGKPFSFDEVKYTQTHDSLTISIKADNLPKDFVPKVEFYRGGAEVGNVISKGTHYPPKKHLGQPLHGRSAFYLGKWTLKYYENLATKAALHFSNS